VAGTLKQESEHMYQSPKPLRALFEFFSTWRFPSCALALLGGVELLQVLALVLPRADSGVGAFAEQFRIWCYGLDPATGRMQWSYVAMFLLQPLGVCGVIWLVWGKQVRTALASEPRRMIPYFGFSLALAFVAIVLLVSVGKPANAAELPFPAKALRTHKPAPVVTLRDQDGKRVDLAALRGHVVVVTGIYATCYHTCPLIMQQLDRSLSALEPEERKQVRVLAVTLNPEHDDREAMAAAAKRYRVAAPEYRLLHGAPREVNATLDRLEIARTTDPMSGDITHANLFLVVDKRGEVAFRLTLGKTQERWLADAVRVLVHEPSSDDG
jgi:protein SCO1/2